MRRNLQTVIIKGRMDGDQGETDVLLVSPSYRASMQTYSLTRDMFTLARIVFHDHFGGYFLFRVLDGLKPGPLRWLDRHVKGGFGVMIDDVAAGAVAALILHWLVPWTAPPLDAMLQRLW